MNDTVHSLREALAFYGNMQNWQDGGFTRTARNTMTLIMSTAMKDRGERARAALAAAPQPENGDALSVLSGISSYLGAGMGDENTTPAEFEKRIRWGIDHHVSAIIALAADTVEHLSKLPNTTWGEVKSAISALAAAPQPAPVDRVALAEVISKALPLWPWAGAPGQVADALLARGLRLPGGDETMAWAVVGDDGEVRPDEIRASKKEAAMIVLDGERIVRVAIRVVEGGNDAA